MSQFSAFTPLLKKDIIVNRNSYLFIKGQAIKNHEILYVISEIIESLSLTEQRNLIVETALDSLSEKIEKLEKSVANVAEKANEKNKPDEFQERLESSTQALLKRTIDLLEQKTGSDEKKK